MKKLFILSTIAAAAFAQSALAEATKIEGEATCAKCTLKQADSCQAGQVGHVVRGECHLGGLLLGRAVCVPSARPTPVGAPDPAGPCSS